LCDQIAAALYQLAAGNRSNLKAVAKKKAGPIIVAARPRDRQTGGPMTLTRDFKDTVVARVQRDPRFRELHFTEAINAYLGGDTAAGKAILRDLVNATVGFEELAAELNKPSKSLHQMLAPRGNPSTENFFSIVSALQTKARVRLRVTAKAG
jgi:DNA-binding phage protein